MSSVVGDAVWDTGMGFPTGDRQDKLRFYLRFYTLTPETGEQNLQVIKTGIISEEIITLKEPEEEHPTDLQVEQKNR